MGATGVKQVLEIWRQMKGQCGDYQVRTVPWLGVAANMGGDDKTVVVVDLPQPVAVGYGTTIGKMRIFPAMPRESSVLRPSRSSSVSWSMPATPTA